MAVAAVRGEPVMLYVQQFKHNERPVTSHCLFYVRLLIPRGFPLNQV